MPFHKCQRSFGVPRDNSPGNTAVLAADVAALAGSYVTTLCREEAKPLCLVVKHVVQAD